MNTESYLGQIRKYEYMIENKLEEITKLKTLAMNISVSTDKENIQTSFSKDKMGDAVAKIVDIEREIDEIVDELVEQRYKIISQIDSMGNTVYYRILTCRYVLGMKIEDIAIKTGYSVDGIKRIKRKAMQNFEELYGKEYKCG